MHSIRSRQTSRLFFSWEFIFEGDTETSTGTWLEAAASEVSSAGTVFSASATIFRGRPRFEADVDVIAVGAGSGSPSSFSFRLRPRFLAG